MSHIPLCVIPTRLDVPLAAQNRHDSREKKSPRFRRGCRFRIEFVTIVCSVRVPVGQRFKFIPQKMISFPNHKCCRFTTLRINVRHQLPASCSRCGDDASAESFDSARRAASAWASAAAFASFSACIRFRSTSSAASCRRFISLSSNCGLDRERNFDL